MSAIYSRHQAEHGTVSNRKTVLHFVIVLVHGSICDDGSISPNHVAVSTQINLCLDSYFATFLFSIYCISDY